MSKFEKKFGKYAIPNLTLILIICYVAGYVIQFTVPQMTVYLTLDPYFILQGQIWRLVTWILIPPSSFDIFTLIMLFFYYNIGTNLERAWGTYRYNVYLFSGMLFTIIGSFLYMGFVYLLGGSDIGMYFASGEFRDEFFDFSTYYINLSIFMAFAVTYPNAQVLLMFVIPVKMKWMGILDAILLGAMFLEGEISTKFAIAACMLNFVIFYFSTLNLRRMAPKEVKRRTEFKQQVKHNPSPRGHKCAICGRTDADDPTLEFRYCSKCNGNYEYCQNHLFTHEHVK
ncbi:MAG: hypothetical protein E7291_01495 [Lachnospiraceae bacterium]|nr:hypothetical protein [Lachnospiraceae bacterium]